MLLFFIELQLADEPFVGSRQPFAFIRIADPSSTPPLIAAVRLVIGISQPGLVLAVQCWMSEGFWYMTEQPPILTSSSAANLEILVEGRPEMVERPGSAASSYYAFKKSHAMLPGIQPGEEDAVETRMGRVGELRRRFSAQNVR